MDEKRITTDILVVGGGMAGWMAASHAREAGASVALVDKGYIGKCGQSPYATGFFCYDPKCGSSEEEMAEEVNRVGEYIANRYWNERTIRESREVYEELRSWGVEFGPMAGPVGIPEPGEHTKFFLDSGFLDSAKFYHKFSETFGYKARRHLIDIGVKLYDRVMVTGLISNEGRVSGAVGICAEDDSVCIFKANAVILCTGGCGMRAPGYPMLASSTGDGEKMAYELGAAVLGKEFVLPMRSSAENATILGGRGLRPGHPASAGKVAHTVINPMGWKVGDAPFPVHPGKLSDYPLAYLDLELELHAGRGPAISGKDGEFVHVVPGGALGLAVRKSDGIWPADDECGTGVPGLYAAGDTLGTMQNGASYILMGGSVCGCAVTGKIAGEAAAREVSGKSLNSETGMQISFSAFTEAARKALDKTLAPLNRRNGYSPRWVIQLLQNTMIPYYVSYIKKADRLEAALTNIRFIREHLIPALYAEDMHELRLAHEAESMALACEIRLRSSLFRTESRGMHFREDYPYRDDENWLAWIRITMAGDNEMNLEKVDVPDEWKTDLNMSYEERYPYRFPGEERRPF